MIRAKAEYIIRTCGLILITSAIPITLLSDWFLIKNWFLWGFYNLIILPWFIVIITQKLMITWIVKRGKIIRIGLSGLFVMVLVISFLLLNQIIKIKEFFGWLLHIIKILTLLICWNYAFSIYKKRKLIFLSSGCFYCGLTIIFLIFITDILNLMLLSLIILIIGMSSVLFGEYIMLKKGLLRYL